MINTVDIRKKINMRYCLLMGAYFGVIGLLMLCWVNIYHYLSVKETCGLGYFIIILVLGGIVIEGIVGEVQLFLLRFNSGYGSRTVFGFYSLQDIKAIGIACSVFWVIYLVAYIFIGIPTTAKIAGIILSVIIFLLSLFFFLLFEYKITDLYGLYSRLYNSTKILDYTVLEYSGNISEYNKKIETYNLMNDEISNIGKLIGGKKSSFKNIDLVNLDMEVPYLNIKLIKVFSCSKQQIKAYMDNVYKLQKAAQKTLRKVGEQRQLIDTQLGKKEGLVKETKRLMQTAQNPAVLESLKSDLCDDARVVYGRLAKKSYMERKIKNIKGGRLK